MLIGVYLRLSAAISGFFAASLGAVARLVGTVPILCETQLKRAACPGSAIDWQTTPADKCRPLELEQATKFPRVASHGRCRVHPSFPQGDAGLALGNPSNFRFKTVIRPKEV